MMYRRIIRQPSPSDPISNQERGGGSKHPSVAGRGNFEGASFLETYHVSHGLRTVGSRDVTPDTKSELPLFRNGTYENNEK